MSFPTPADGARRRTVTSPPYGIFGSRPSSDPPGDELLLDQPVPVAREPEWDDRDVARDEAVPIGGGRRLLAILLMAAAIAWLGFAAWSAGRAIGQQPFDLATLAPWLASSATPLVLLALLWLIFGRTRRREAERFTRAVQLMRQESRSLEQTLADVGGRLRAQRDELDQMSGNLVQIGEQTGQRLAAVTGDLARHGAMLGQQGAAIDAAAAAARTDLGVILTDLPRAEAAALALSERLRDAGTQLDSSSVRLTSGVDALAQRASAAGQDLARQAALIEERNAAIEASSQRALAQFETLGREGHDGVARLLDQVARALSDTRAGIAEQSAAVAALAQDSEQRLGRAGQGAAESLGQHLERAGAALDQMSTRIAEQERAAQRLLSGLDQGLTTTDERLQQLVASSADRAMQIGAHLSRIRTDIDALGSEAAGHDQRFAQLDERTAAIRAAVDDVSRLLQTDLDQALGQSEERAARLMESGAQVRPAIEAIRDAAVEASDRLANTGQQVASQEQQLARLLGAIQAESDAAEQRLAALNEALRESASESDRISRESAPALLQAMAQVREASAQAAQRAREAMAAIIPDSAALMGTAASNALNQALNESVDRRLVDLDARTAHALGRTREASEGLTRQMMAMSQHAHALDQWIEKSRESSGDQFARRVSLLLDSMHSASIDVGKILSDELDDKAWGAYLKGDRSIFTRRAARLAASSELKPIAAHYDSDPEFQQAVGRYIADFEAMLRRVSAEPDGGPIAVTLMSSDMGKLYAVLNGAIEKRRDG